jgi:hypothetical protein
MPWISFRTNINPSIHPHEVTLSHKRGGENIQASSSIHSSHEKTQITMASSNPIDQRDEEETRRKGYRTPFAYLAAHICVTSLNEGAIHTILAEISSPRISCQALAGAIHREAVFLIGPTPVGCFCPPDI